jgi:hypothetical protein
MLRVVVPLLLIAALPVEAAPKKKETQFWNLTGVTLKDVRLAPAGTRKWGPNQCRNDSDGEVDFDERLPVTATAPGRYDVRMRDTRGRTCTARGVEVREGEVFVIHQRDLPGCPWQ